MSLLEVTKKGFCWIEMRTILIVFGIVNSVRLWWDIVFDGGFVLCGFRVWLVFLFVCFVGFFGGFFFICFVGCFFFF